MPFALKHFHPLSYTLSPFLNCLAFTSPSFTSLSDQWLHNRRCLERDSSPEEKRGNNKGSMCYLLCGFPELHHSSPCLTRNVCDFKGSTVPRFLCGHLVVLPWSLSVPDRPQYLLLRSGLWVCLSITAAINRVLLTAGRDRKTSRFNTRNKDKVKSRSYRTLILILLQYLLIPLSS